jgi:hypothetical protein
MLPATRRKRRHSSTNAGARTIIPRSDQCPSLRQEGYFRVVTPKARLRASATRAVRPQLSLRNKARQIRNKAIPLAGMGRMVTLFIQVQNGAGDGLLDILCDSIAIVVARGSVDEQAGHLDRWQNRPEISSGKAAPAGDQGGLIKAIQPLAQPPNARRVALDLAAGARVVSVGQQLKHSVPEVNGQSGQESLIAGFRKIAVDAEGPIGICY